MVFMLRATAWQGPIDKRSVGRPRSDDIVRTAKGNWLKKKKKKERMPIPKEGYLSLPN